MMQAFASHNLQPGDRITSETDVFEIKSVLGQGGMGIVYLANQTTLNRPVALKLVRTEGEESALFIQRLRKEAKGTALLDHPNIVRVYSFNVSDQHQPFLVMEYIQGRTLRELIDGRSIDRDLFFKVCCQVLDALKTAHAAGLIHRDIKPGNIIVTADGTAKLMDFGVAKHTLSGTTTQSLTQAGGCIGSPLYMSPEQCRGEAVDGRSDLYSLGCVMFEMLTGKTPFDGETPLEVMFQQLNQGAPQLPNVPKQLADIIERSLAKDRDARFDSAALMLDALEPCRSLDIPFGQQAIKSRTGTNIFTGKKRLALLGALGAALFTLAIVATVQLVRSDKGHTTVPDAATSSGPQRPEVASPKTLRDRAQTMSIEGAELQQQNESAGRRMRADALALAKKSIAVATNEHSALDIALGHSLVGRMLLIEDPKNAIESFNQALEYFRRADQAQCDDALDTVENLGNALRSMNDYKASIEKLQEAYKGAQIANGKQGSLRAHAIDRDLGRTYYQMGKYKEAQDAYVDALKQATMLGPYANPALFAITLNERADILFKQQRYDEWLKMLNESAAYWQKVQPETRQSVQGEAAIYAKIADGLSKQGKTEMALQACAKGRQLLVRTGAPQSEIAFSDLEHSEILWNAGKKQEAISTVSQLELDLEPRKLLTSVVGKLTLLRLATYNAAAGNVSQSRFWEDKAIAAFSPDDQRAIYEIYVALGDTYFTAHDIPNCLRIYKKSYDIALPFTPNWPPAENAMTRLRLANAYLLSNDPKSAAPLIKECEEICAKNKLAPFMTDVLAQERAQYLRMTKEEI